MVFGGARVASGFACPCLAAGIAVLRSFAPMATTNPAPFKSQEVPRGHPQGKAARTIDFPHGERRRTWRRRPVVDGTGGGHTSLDHSGIAYRGRQFESAHAFGLHIREIGAVAVLVRLLPRPRGRDLPPGKGRKRFTFDAQLATTARRQGDAVGKSP